MRRHWSSVGNEAEGAAAASQARRSGGPSKVWLVCWFSHVEVGLLAAGANLLQLLQDAVKVGLEAYGGTGREGAGQKHWQGSQMRG